MIRALGAGVGNNSEEEGSFDASKLRYSKIIIMCDADIDGAHKNANVDVPLEVHEARHRRGACLYRSASTVSVI